VLESKKPQMRINLGTWAIAGSVAVLSAVGALYITRSASPSLMTGSQQMAGRDYPSVHAPDPLTADEIGYQVARDRIRAIDAPRFMASTAASFVPERLPVIGVTQGRELKGISNTALEPS